MSSIKIRKKHVDTFNKIIGAYNGITIIPQEGRWKDFDNNELWIRHIVQIIVIGQSKGSERFYSNPALAKMLQFENLKSFTESNRLKNINKVLRAAKVRYASADITRCMKTQAIAHNFNFVNQYPNAFSGIIQMLASLKGVTAEIDRVNFFKENLKFMKHKSARDYLMGIGLNRHTVAIDIRFQKIFSHVGIDFPTEGELGKGNVYDETEKIIIHKICKPLKIEPVVFDRILYQNYDKIMKSDYLMPRLF